MDSSRPKPKADAYDPTKPSNEQVRALIRNTHEYSSRLILPAGKRFKIDHGTFYEQEANDGIGTKGLIHWRMNTVEKGVQDGFAMVADDLFEGGYRPKYLIDHIQMQEENDKKLFSMISKLCELCTEYKISITGGETAIINTLQGFEMGITMRGFVAKEREIIKNAKIGDVIIAMASNGMHSNGFTFIREEMLSKQRYDLGDKAPWDKSTTVGEELTIPTRLYMPALSELIHNLTVFEPANQYIHGMVHITGGGLSKLKELIPEGNADIIVDRKHSLEPQPIFTFINREFKIPSEKMYTRFNSGIGYAMAVDETTAEMELPQLRKHFPSEIIGRVVEGSGKVRIESKYDKTTVVY